MSIINYDYLKLREDICFLLDSRYGESRAEKCQYFIKHIGEVSVSPLFGRGYIPDELFHIAKQDASMALRIVDAANAKRIKIEESESKMAKTVVSRRKLLRKNSELYRERITNTLLAIEIKLGRKLTKDEEKDAIEKAKVEWKQRRDDFLASNTHMKYQAASKHIANVLNEEARLSVEEALLAKQGG